MPWTAPLDHERSVDTSETRSNLRYLSRRPAGNAVPPDTQVKKYELGDDLLEAKPGPPSPLGAVGEALAKAWACPAHEIAQAARAAVFALQGAAHSPFVAKRLQKLSTLIDMLEDPEWQLPEPERRRVLGGLACVAEASDTVPDSVPALGLVDDATMLELVLRELLHDRIRERRERELEERGGGFPLITHF